MRSARISVSTLVTYEDHAAAASGRSASRRAAARRRSTRLQLSQYCPLRRLVPEAAARAVPVPADGPRGTATVEKLPRPSSHGRAAASNAAARSRTSGSPAGRLDSTARNTAATTTRRCPRAGGPRPAYVACTAATKASEVPVDAAPPRGRVASIAAHVRVGRSPGRPGLVPSERTAVAAVRSGGREVRGRRRPSAMPATRNAYACANSEAATAGRRAPNPAVVAATRPGAVVGRRRGPSHRDQSSPAGASVAQRRYDTRAVHGGEHLVERHDRHPAPDGRRRGALDEARERVEVEVRPRAGRPTRSSASCPARGEGTSGCRRRSASRAWSATAREEGGAEPVRSRTARAASCRGRRPTATPSTCGRRRRRAYERPRPVGRDPPVVDPVAVRRAGRGRWPRARQGDLLGPRTSCSPAGARGRRPRRRPTRRGRRSPRRASGSRRRCRARSRRSARDGVGEAARAQPGEVGDGRLRCREHDEVGRRRARRRRCTKRTVTPGSTHERVEVGEVGDPREPHDRDVERVGEPRRRAAPAGSVAARASPRRRCRRRRSTGRTPNVGTPGAVARAARSRRAAAPGRRAAC